MKAQSQLLSYNLKLQTGTERSIHDEVWATTFSDLVTLLLCFFLTMVSFGPVGQVSSTGTDPQMEVMPASQRVEKGETGIPIALSGSGVGRRQIELSQKTLLELEVGAPARVIEEAKKIIVSGSYLRRRVTIVVTPEAGQQGSGPRWMSILQRITELERQLFDSRRGIEVVLRLTSGTMGAQGQPLLASDGTPLLGEIVIEDLSI